MAKIIEEKINTDGSARDIEDTTWIPHETVAKVLRDEFAQVCTNSPAVSDLVTRNDRLQSSADTLLQKLIDAWKDIKVSDLVSVRDSAFKQNQLLQWKATEKVEHDLSSSEGVKKALEVLLK